MKYIYIFLLLLLCSSVLPAQGQITIKQTLAAMKDPSAEKRQAALGLTSARAGEKEYIELLKYMQKAKPEVKADILNWIAKEAQIPEKNKILKPLEIRFDLTARQAIINQLNKGDFPVKEAAVWALTYIGDEASISTLAALLREPDEQIVQLARDALFIFKGNINQPVARIIPAATDAGKIAAVELLAARKASAHINTVFELIRSGTPEVKEASYIALKDLATYNNWVLLCGMLEEITDLEVIPLIQDALITAISSQPTSEQVPVITNRMRQAGEKNKYLYYRILATIGSEEAFNVIRQGLDDDDPVIKKAAMEVL